MYNNIHTKHILLYIMYKIIILYKKHLKHVWGQGIQHLCIGMHAHPSLAHVNGSGSRIWPACVCTHQLIFLERLIDSGVNNNVSTWCQHQHPCELKKLVKACCCSLPLPYRSLLTSSTIGSGTKSLLTCSPAERAEDLLKCNKNKWQCSHWSSCSSGFPKWRTSWHKCAKLRAESSRL